MRSRLFVSGLAAILALLVLSCEEPFTPKAPFVPRPVVICIISATEHNGVYLMPVSATVARTYDVAGLDPMANTIDPFDTAAVVSVTVGNVNDQLRLFKLPRADAGRYTTKEFRFQDHGLFHMYGVYTLSVTTGKGEQLRATTTVPPRRMIGTSYQFPAGVTPITTNPHWTFDWNDEQRNDHLYFPKLLLQYQVITPESTVDKKLEIPLTYVEKDGKKVPVYPSFTRDLSVTYDFSAMATAIESIAEVDTVKSHYKIGWLYFQLIEYDTNLSNFYASSHGYLDAYSIRVDESTYTNVTGGVGVFGSSFFNNIFFEMKLQYIRSLGYRM